MSFLKKIILSPNGFFYQSLRSLYFSLPYKLRDRLKNPANTFVLWAGKNSPNKMNAPKDPCLRDISWHEFSGNILSNRSKYKGVFIQDLVIDWNVPLYQRPQHIACALGRLGYLVIYQTGNWAGDDVNGFREVEKNVWITNTKYADGIDGAVRSIYSTAHMHSPESIKINRKNGIVIYEYIDHIDPEISGDMETIRRLTDLKNFAFAGGVDFIVASANKLYHEAVQAVGRERVILVPNGVDTKHYRNFINHEIKLPKDLIDFREKYKIIVGYFGALAPWLWYDCIEELAVMRSDIGFVFIGPDYYGGANKLPKHRNVLKIGAVDYKILPAYANLFDVCFIPFKPGEIAKTTSPLKLFEYFAMEKPVVVTSDMSECTVYEEVFKGGSASELSRAIDEATKAKDKIFFKERLRSLASDNDWLQRAECFELCFEEPN